MKKILKSRLVLTLASFVLIAAAIAVPLVSSIAHSAHANTVGLRVYVTSDSGGTVSVIDSGTNSVINTITVGRFPRGIVVSPDNARVYVSNFTYCCSVGPGTISVIDTSTYNVVATIPVGNNPTGMAITPDGTRLYVSEAFGGEISVIDTSSNTIINSISVQNPDQMIMTADGSRLYVSGNNGIVVIDTASNTVIHTIPVSNLQGHPVVSPDGSRLYVSNTTLTVYDTNTYSILFTIPTDSPVENILINNSGTRIYAGSGQGPSSVLLVIDTTTNTQLTSIPLGTNFGLPAILPDDSAVYVPLNGSIFEPNSNTVSVIDTASNTVVRSIVVGLNPFAIAIEKNINHSPVVNSIPSVTLSEGNARN